MIFFVSLFRNEMFEMLIKILAPIESFLSIGMKISIHVFLIGLNFATYLNQLPNNFF